MTGRQPRMQTLLDERRDAVALLKRIADGDTSAIADIQPLLDSIALRVKSSADAFARAELKRAVKPPLEVLDRGFNGASWGGRPQVIARGRDGLVLIWVPGATTYVDREHGRRYGASELRIVKSGDLHDRTGTKLHEGGRLSVKLIRRYAKKIDTAFGHAVAEQITLKETLEVTP